MTPLEELKQLEQRLKTAQRHEIPILNIRRKALIEQISKEDKFSEMFGDEGFGFLKDLFEGRKTK